MMERAVLKDILPEKLEMMKGFKELPPEELEKISGGIVVKDGDVYMILSDDGKLLRPGSLNVLHQRTKLCRS